MSYSTEGGMPTRDRRRRRTAIVICCLFAILALALLAVWGIQRGWLGGGTAGASGTATKRTCTTTPLAAPSTITVNVYNATSRVGLAKTTAAALKAQGFRIGSTTNDPLGKAVPGAAEVRYGSSGAAQARSVAARVSGAVLVKDTRTDASVDLVLGETFAKVVTPKAASATC